MVVCDWLVSLRTLCENTSCLKKVPTFKLSVKRLYICQLLTNFQTFCTAGKRMKCATRPYDIVRFTLGMLLDYLGKLKIQIVCRYSADIEKMQTN